MRKRSNPIRRIVFRLLAVMLGGLAFLCGIYLLWYFNRPQPPPVNEQPLFEGVTYTRVVDEDAPLVYHVARIHLSAAGIGFLATPGDDIDGYVYAARTPEQFLQDYGLQVAINGDFFDPWWAYHSLDYYPHVGDGVNARGLVISQGQVVSAGYARPRAFRTLYITADNRASFQPPSAPAQTAISGNTMVVINGELNHRLNRRAYESHRHPRTAIALDEAGETLLLFVVDGRQPGYSRGVSMQELGTIILAHGGYNALNMDGGGSAALIIAGADGQPQQLGSAIHTRIPYRQRPVANHFGVYARGLPDQYAPAQAVPHR